MVMWCRPSDKTSISKKFSNKILSTKRAQRTISNSFGHKTKLAQAGKTHSNRPRVAELNRRPQALRDQHLTYLNSREQVSLAHSITTSSISSAARPWLSWVNTSSRSCFNLQGKDSAQGRCFRIKTSDHFPPRPRR